MLITSQGARRGTPHRGRSFEENTSLFLLFFSQPFLNNLNLFPGGKKKTPSTGSCIPSGFSPLSGGQPGSIGHMTMVWTAKLLLCSGAGGLAVKPYMATK